MDWYTWLSKTNLDASFILHYGLTMARNELREDDLPYFNHDFLQSIGISVAKHRLEILKLCRKESRGGSAVNNGFSRLVLVVNKTRKLFARNISKLGFHRSSAAAAASPYRSPWSGPLRRIDNRQDRTVDRRLQEKLSVSGPLDVRVHDKAVYPSRSPMVGRGNERSGLVCRSPVLSGPIDRFGLSPNVGHYRSEKIGGGAQSLWSIMFQDMKPT